MFNAFNFAAIPNLQVFVQLIYVAVCRNFHADGINFVFHHKFAIAIIEHVYGRHFFINKVFNIFHPKSQTVYQRAYKQFNFEGCYQGYNFGYKPLWQK